MKPLRQGGRLAQWAMLVALAISLGANSSAQTPAKDAWEGEWIGELPKDRAAYLEKIRRGSERTRLLVARDEEATREAWEIALAPRERDVLEEFASTKKTPADLLRFAANNLPPGAAADDFARNPAAPRDLLEQLSNSSDKQVLWGLRENPATPAPALARALQTLAESSSANERWTAAEDSRTSLALLGNLARDPNVTVRRMVPRSKICSSRRRKWQTRK